MKDLKISMPEYIGGCEINTIVVNGMKLYCLDCFENEKYISGNLFNHYLDYHFIKVFDVESFDYEKYGEYKDIFFKYFEEHFCLIFKFLSFRYISRRVLEDYMRWCKTYMTSQLCII